MIPVVIRADLMAAGDHVGLNDLTYTAAAVACGQDMDVPEMILYGTILLSLDNLDGLIASDQAAKMSTPGAVRSGCIK